MGLGDVIDLSKALSNHNKFDLLLDQLAEAKRELEHVRIALGRMEAICRLGAAPTAIEYGPKQREMMSRFDNELKRFDNWVISLVETDLSMVDVIGPGDPLKNAFHRSLILRDLRRALARSPWGFAY